MLRQQREIRANVQMAPTIAQVLAAQTRKRERKNSFHLQALTIVNVHLSAKMAPKWAVKTTQTDMPSGRRLSAMERGRALAWLAEGVSLREMARRHQMSVSVFHRLHKRYATTGSTEEWACS